MSSEEAVIVEKSNFITTLSINRPDRRNAMNRDVLISLISAISDMGDDSETRVLIIRGAGEKSFCSGADIAPGEQRPSGENLIEKLTGSIINCPRPVVAMIYGFALGAGCDLAAACDLRIAADNARIGLNPVKMGWTYGPSAIRRFTGLIGEAYTRELLLTGRFLSAGRAHEIGLINYVVPEVELASATQALAAELAENAPLAMKAMKYMINKLSYSSQEIAPELSAELRNIDDALWGSEDVKEGIKAFTEKRKPQFKGQ